MERAEGGQRPAVGSRGQSQAPVGAIPVLSACIGDGLSHSKSAVQDMFMLSPWPELLDGSVLFKLQVTTHLSLLKLSVLGHFFNGT